MRRRELLDALAAQGLNTFRAHGLSADQAQVRLPAFVRAADDHEGARSGLLRNRAELAEAVAEAQKQRAPIEEWLIVEFCDTIERDGFYRKYSAFRIGPHIIPRHLFIGQAWVLKHSESLQPDHLAEEQAYIRTNPHREELMRIFELARIDYGRIDYGLRGGRLQVWEINTNPMLLWRKHLEETARLPVHRQFADRVAAVLDELNRTAAPGRGYPVEWLRTTKRVGWEMLKCSAAFRAALAQWRARKRAQRAG
jgi:hypothetical protein